MKKFFDEFKKFINQGNVMDMAVGVIIGAAFKAIVDSLVNDIISPILGVAGGVDFSAVKIHLTGDSYINIGNFINAVINFLLMALILFAIVKFMYRATEDMKKLTGKKEEEPAKPTTKMCPYCRSEIPIEATRCPHCTSMLTEEKQVEKK